MIRPIPRYAQMIFVRPPRHAARSSHLLSCLQSDDASYVPFMLSIGTTIAQDPGGDLVPETLRRKPRGNSSFRITRRLTE
jgi:hypothetical protein